MNNTYKIEYNGQILETIHWKEISQEKYNELKQQFYEKPEFKVVQKQFLSIANGGTINNEITNYYVKDLMCKTRIYYNKYSIEDVFNCKQLVEHFYAKVQENKKVYHDTDSDIKKIETAFRIGGKGIASKPANFPIKTIDMILKKYNVNNNWYDFSCGWGARLTGALKNKVNYYGTDPNYLLTERLEQLAKDYNETTWQKLNYDIRTQGSEIFIPEWENKIGLAFSSPPYFYLEDYKVGNQSFKEGTTYQQWKDNYLELTIKNIYSYLIDGGYFILNINNFDKYKLVEDSIELATKNGFTLIGEHTLENISRCKENGDFNDNNERILIFSKNGFDTKFHKESEQISLFD